MSSMKKKDEISYLLVVIEYINVRWPESERGGQVPYSAVWKHVTTRGTRVYRTRPPLQLLDKTWCERMATPHGGTSRGLEQSPKIRCNI